MEMQIVEATRWLQSPFFDAFFKIVSWFGTELFFLMVFAILYWVYRREYALKFGLFYLVSVGINGLIKVAFNRTRPNGGEHSFPSGHSQSFAVQGTMITKEVFGSGVSKGRKIWVLCDIFVAWFVIAYSRMYLNFHFLTDVLAGLLIAIIIVLLGDYIWSLLPAKFKTLQAKHIVQYSLIGLAVILIIVFSVSTTMVNKMVTNDSYLVIYELAGALIGACVGDLLNDRFVCYDARNDSTTNKVLKAFTGISIMALYYYFVVIRLAMKLLYLLPIAYMIMMFVVTYLLPLIFKKWASEDNRIEEMKNKGE